MSNLQLRLLTAAVGLPAVAALTWVGGWPFAIAAAVVALLAAAEFTHGWLLPSMPLSAVIPQFPMFGATAVIVGGAHTGLSFPVLGLLVALAVGALGYSRTNALGPRKPLRIAAWCLFYVGVLFSTIVLVRDLDHGREWVFLGLLSTFAVDTGAYAVGRLVGRHPMAAGISPKKTWEGAVGGYVAGVATVFALNALLDTGEGALVIAPLALLLPIATQAGDLVKSAIKRRMGVKDASGFFPGHGGFLDRLDSVLFAMPLLYVFLRAIGHD
ncbi:MAG: phosphatidate cytidylyltransferase [Tepidiformaceae bacterium]